METVVIQHTKTFVQHLLMVFNCTVYGSNGNGNNRTSNSLLYDT